mmetsp:Transcript_71020/g.196116  ORF Transcript_71020/g.196116 Transcript_71020/m.196116 type:complete len:206 (-) Transcript_71020:92-709(-)
MAKRLILACAKNPLGFCGRPNPRRPSKGPPKSRSLRVMSKRPSFMSASHSPMRTLSRATVPMTSPLPSISVILRSRPFAARRTAKDAERFVPVKQRSLLLQEPFSRQAQDGMMRSSLPVSTSGLSFWPGVPTSMPTLKDTPWLTSSAQVPGSAASIDTALCRWCWSSAAPAPTVLRAPAAARAQTASSPACSASGIAGAIRYLVR